MSNSGLITTDELIKMGRLVEHPIEGSPYSLLGLADPSATPTLSERVAIAKRIVELSGKLPQYAKHQPKPKPADDLSALPEGMTVDYKSIVSIASAMGLTTSFDRKTDAWTVINPQHGNVELKAADVAKMTSNDLRSKLNPPGHVITMTGRQYAEGAKDGGTPVAKARPGKDSQPAAQPTKENQMSTKKTSTKKTSTKTAAAAPAKKRSDADPSAKVAGVSAAVAKGAGNGFDENAKITWLVKANPRREGSDTHRRFAKYSGATTVRDYFAKGGTPGDLRWDVKHKYLTVSKTK